MPTNLSFQARHESVHHYDDHIHIHYYTTATPAQVRSNFFVANFQSYVDNYVSPGNNEIEEAVKTAPLLRNNSSESIQKVALKEELAANFVSYDSYRQKRSNSTYSNDNHTPHSQNKGQVLIHNTDFIDFRSRLLEDLVSYDLQHNEKIEDLCSKYYNICDRDVQKFEDYINHKFLPEVTEVLRTGDTKDIDYSLDLQNILK